MAITSVTVEAWPNGVDTTKSRVIIYGTIVLAALTVVPVAINWNSLIDGNFGSGKFNIPNVGPDQVSAGPDFAEAHSTTANSPETYQIVGNDLCQYTNGTPVTSAVGDTIKFKAEFLKERF